MQLRIDHAAVAFAADHGARLLHLGHHVHLADGRRGVFAAVPFGNVAQRPRRGEVRNGVAARILRQNIVGHGNQRILLDEHRAVLADQRQPVHVGIDDDAQIGFLAADRLRDSGQVFGQRFGVVGEFACRVAVQLHDFAPQPPQEFGHNDAAHGIHGVHDHLEAAFADRLGVHERKRQHLLDMRPVERFARKHMPDAVHAGVLEALLLGHRQHALALGVGEEFAVGVEQLQGVPLTRVVRRGDDDAAVGPLGDDGHLGARRGAEPDVDHVGAAGQQGALDQIGDHFARNTGVAAYDYGKFFAGIPLGDQTCVCGGEFHDVGGRQVLGLRPAHRAADTGNGFDECHILKRFIYTYIYEKLSSKF